MKRWEDEPPSGGWDAADTVSGAPEALESAAPTRPNLTPSKSPAGGSAFVPPAAVSSAPAMRAPYQTSPGVGGPPPMQPPTIAAAPVRAAAPGAAAGAGLGTAMREEVWAIVRAAVEEAMGPLVARQRELEARVERAERERDGDRAKGAPAAQSVAPAGGASAAAKLASIGPVGGASSIPVAFGASVAPPAFAVRPAPVPLFEGLPGSATIPDIAAPAAVAAVAKPEPKMVSAHPVGPRPSLPPTGYGVTVTAASRASLDLSSVGAVEIDGFDGGRSKRRVATIVIVIVLLVIAGLVTMTVLSHG